jgi:hypothetical protein
LDESEKGEEEGRGDGEFIGFGRRLESVFNAIM